MRSFTEGAIRPQVTQDPASLKVWSLCVYTGLRSNTCASLVVYSSTLFLQYFSWKCYTEILPSLQMY